MSGAQSGPKNSAQGDLELELQVVVNNHRWVLGTNLKSSARAAMLLNCMNVCVCVCVCVCACAHTHACMCACAQAGMYT